MQKVSLYMTMITELAKMWVKKYLLFKVQREMGGGGLKNFKNSMLWYKVKENKPFPHGLDSTSHMGYHLGLYIITLIFCYLWVLPLKTPAETDRW